MCVCVCGGGGWADLLHPLADRTIDFFALDNVFYHGHNVSVIWDSTGERWPHSRCGKGLCVFVDDKIVNRSDTLSRLEMHI